MSRGLHIRRECSSYVGGMRAISRDFFGLIAAMAKGMKDEGGRFRGGAPVRIGNGRGENLFHLVPGGWNGVLHNTGALSEQRDRIDGCG